jgi:lipid-A-disaccharide synthase
LSALSGPSPKRVLLSCGEPSGDAYAAELLRELRGQLPQLEAFGIGGDRLREQGCALLADQRELAVVGLLEVVKHLRRIRAVFDALVAEAERRRPDVAVLIDYPDFNLRLGRALHARGIPVVYYVSPQLWAWRRGRIHSIRRTARRMLVIFPFEEAIYRDAGVPVRFVGHPLVDLVRPPADPQPFFQRLGLDPQRPLVTLLPGSRPSEIAHNLPGLAAAARVLAGRDGRLQFVAAVAPSLDPEMLRPPLAGGEIRLVHGETVPALAAARVALVASGTATVETALVGTPMVVVYRLAALTYFLGRPLVRVPHVAMVNLIAGRRAVPELIQGEFRPERVAAEAARLLPDDEPRHQMLRDLAEVRERLGAGGASRRAAAAVLESLEG